MTALDLGWTPPPPVVARLAISGTDVHLWRVSLNQPGEVVQELAQNLSTDERSRAERFRFERDRVRYIVGRGLLRSILGRYLGLAGDRLCFRYSSHGKPDLDTRGFENSRCPVPNFNMARSGDLALHAIVNGNEVGVDLERIRFIPEAEKIIERFFSPREQRVFRSLPSDQKQEAFFNCWTRKEAYLKAMGDGLARPLDEFDVSLAPGEPARLLNMAGSPEEASRWSILDLRPAPGYVAALVVKGHGWKIKYWDYDALRG